jgi:hypothetical protein
MPKRKLVNCNDDVNHGTALTAILPAYLAPPPRRSFLKASETFSSLSASKRSVVAQDESPNKTAKAKRPKADDAKAIALGDGDTDRSTNNVATNAPRKRGRPRKVQSDTKAVVSHSNGEHGGDDSVELNVARPDNFTRLRVS